MTLSHNMFNAINAITICVLTLGVIERTSAQSVSSLVMAGDRDFSYDSGSVTASPPRGSVRLLASILRSYIRG